MTYTPIADYALIGDCHGSALVSREGAIDWACVARFDDGAMFCRLLDQDKGGTFSLTPRERTSVTRRYLPDTNVLETTFTTKTGTARVLDCFTMRAHGRTQPYRQLLRVVEGDRGAVTFDALIQPRFDYASLRPWLRHFPDRGVYSAVGGDDAFVLQADVPLRIAEEDASFRGEVAVRGGQRRRFSIVAQPPYDMKLERLPDGAIDRRLNATIAWWRRWVKRGSYDAAYRGPVVRSALLLKLLTCAPTGAVIAAPTTSLPERPGGERNWDYRFSWVRDSAHTLAALFAVGHPEVATGFKLFIERATAGHADDLQVVYGCYGERRLTEEQLNYLDGYGGSRPVRVGNGAARQRQLDVYGELLNAAHLWRRAGTGVTEDGWRFLRGLVDAACAHWNEPDRGLWEVRGEPRHFVESKVMCWVALERGVRAAEELGLACDLERWRSVREEIRSTIERKGVDPGHGGFVQSFGSREVDASLLLLPIVGFVDANDPRMRATVDAIERDLCDGLLVRRYRPGAAPDGLHGGEGAFLMASFWLVDVLAMQGRLAEAESRFQRLLALANDVGLFSEECDLSSRELLGNFPQAFTHMAVINSAEQLYRLRSGGDHKCSVTERGNVRANRPIGRDTLHHTQSPHRPAPSRRRASR
ncbi:MAG TPA: glycoside hydrolase family 15 protein [Polyangiaceae bacterium]|nr:glycoside hydrolase family 15 protein [Polyangiaceae bacterium]